MRSSVIVTGPPSAICRRKIGTTEPDEPSTLPKVTVANFVFVQRCAAASTAYSASALDAPITVAGCTALSVETSTNRATPASAATRAMSRVASALLRTASTGLSSISATCLYAAAWKTTVGRCCAKTSRIRSPSLQSARTAASTDGWTWRSPASSRWIRKRLSSAWSMSTSRRGATRAIWRHSSEPIDPPAPVTSTVSPLRYAPTRSSSMRTGSRPRTSSTCTSRTWRTTVPGPDCSSSNTVGSVRTGIPRRRPSRTTRAQRAGGGRDRDRQLVRLGLVEDAAEILRRAEHADALDANAALERVVVDEADRVEVELRVAHDLAQDEPAALAGADDQD